MTEKVKSDQAVVLCNPQVSRGNDGKPFLKNPELNAFVNALSFAGGLAVSPTLFMSIDHPFRVSSNRGTEAVMRRDLVSQQAWGRGNRGLWFTLADLRDDLKAPYITALDEAEIETNAITILPEQSLSIVMAAMLRRNEEYRRFAPHSERRLSVLNDEGTLIPGCIAVAAAALYIAAKKDVVGGRLKSRTTPRDVTVFWQYDGRRTNDSLINEAHRFLTESTGLHLAADLIRHVRVGRLCRS